jgi:aminobenzoyl-glutamate utilization protein B
MPDGARVHYAMLDGGGVAPNVVQARAKVRYLIRASDLAELNPLVARVRKIAEGAALMTETSVETRVVSAVSNLLGNAPLEKLMHDNFLRLGPPAFDDEDRAVAAKFQETLTKEDIFAAHRRHGLKVEPGKVLCDMIVPLNAHGAGGVGSTDVGDVSWVVPTIGFSAATFVPGVAAHTWQAAASAGMSIGQDGMVVASKALALTAVDLLSNPQLIGAAKADFAKELAGKTYRSAIPEGQKPLIDYRGK